MCVCVTFCVCMTKKKIIFRILLLVLWIYTPSFLTWNEEGCTTPCYFFFSFLMSHAFFFFISSFPFIVWSSGAVYFWIFFGRLFLLKCDCSLFFFFGRRQSSCSISWTSSLYVYFFFLNLGDAKNWQQKERKKKWVHRTCGHSHVTSRIFSPSLNGTHTHTWKEKKKS